MVQVDGVLHRQVGIVAVDVHPQLHRRIGHFYAHGAQTDDAQVLAHELRPHELALLLLHQLLHVPVGVGEIPGPLDAPDHVPGGQQQRTDHQLLHGVGVGAGGVEDHDTRLGAPIDGNVVGAGAGPGNGPEVGAERHLVHIGGAHQNAVGVVAAVGHAELIGVQLVQAQGGNLVQSLNIVHGWLLLTQLFLSNSRMKSQSFSTPSMGMAL